MSNKEPAFQGVVGRTIEDSTAWWPKPVRPPEGAPNVLMIVLDDVGFAQLNCYGADIETPHMDRLAANGLRYNNFTTTALCSPTRACLLTGRNHHSVAMGGITEVATGYPGYNGQMPKDKATVAAMLRQEGYSTFCLGKWHNTPADETGPSGPFDRWPTGEMMGFDRFYGFLGAETNQWYPALVADNHTIQAPKGPEEGYHFSEDITEQAMQLIMNQESTAPDKPWLLWLAYGAMHAPHHAPKEWIEKYKGKFDEGWDKARAEIFARQKELGIIPEHTELSERNEGVQAWDDLSADEQRLFARMMEVYAGFMSHTDHQIGRLLDCLEELGQLENTLIFVVSDNGASAEGGPLGSFNEMLVINAIPHSLEDNLVRIDELGGPMSYNHYPIGWSNAGNTPFKWFKQNTYYGGTKDPFIIHWPKGIQAKGEVRKQFHHCIDIVPTILEAAGIEAPAAIGGYTQAPVEGVSMLYSFDDANAPSQRQTQYYEMVGHRAIYHKGWKAVTYHGSYPWELTPAKNQSFSADKWELYHVDEDYAEIHDLADQYPEKVQELIELWWAEAGRYNVLPLDDRKAERFLAKMMSNQRDSYTFYPGAKRIPESLAPNVKNRSHTITAEVEIDEQAEGPICAIGGRPAGWSLYIKDNHLAYCYNYVGERHYIRSTSPVPTDGPVNLRFSFQKTGPQRFGAGGTGRLYINNQLVGQGEIPRTVPFRYSLEEGFDIGHDSATPVTEEYSPNAKFTGTIKKVSFDLTGKLEIDPETEFRIAQAQQ
ncbi:MAG: arylsulfatase [Ardenticatenaceae bacterium]